MVRRALPVICMLLSLVSTSAFAKELWVPIAGNAQGGNFFRTDLRILNPSSSKDITVEATYLPVDRDNTTAAPVQITVPKRQMLAYNNGVSALFNTGGFGAIRFTSADDFVVTSRTFADNPCAAGGIFGQFIPALSPEKALSRGVVLQLSTSADSSQGFRSNVGFANVKATPVTISLILYGSSNEILKTATLDVPPFGAHIASIPAIFALPDLSATNEWVSFTSTGAVLGYGSVVDNRSADQIFVTASNDPPPQTQPPARTLNVEVGPYLAFTPAQIVVRPGDTVVWTFHGFHTTTSNTGSGPEAWDSGLKSSGTFSHQFQTVGTYPYYCGVHSSPTGTMMNGVVTVDGGTSTK